MKSRFWLFCDGQLRSKRQNSPYVFPGSCIPTNESLFICVRPSFPFHPPAFKEGKTGPDTQAKFLLDRAMRVEKPLMQTLTSQLSSSFDQGLKPGSNLLVKFPFKRTFPSKWKDGNAMLGTPGPTQCICGNISCLLSIFHCDSRTYIVVNF